LLADPDVARLYLGGTPSRRVKRAVRAPPMTAPGITPPQAGLRHGRQVIGTAVVCAAGHGWRASGWPWPSLLDLAEAGRGSTSTRTAPMRTAPADG